MFKKRQFLRRPLTGSEISACQKKGGFLTPKRNSCSLSCYHFYWTDLFLSATGGKCTCLLSHIFAALGSPTGRRLC